ncbi:hypothetical protein AAG570_009756 [Ranatra chinensis]|uniref:GH18 domain-containing protein n=1 Tax=Ranatra chinensis TaxID=642074 RepID=A0ABD0YQ12_9HEMI
MLKMLYSEFQPKGWVLSAAISASPKNSTIQYLLHSGVQPNKLIIGVPLYSRTFTLKNIEQNAYWAPTIGPGKKGPVTKATGILAYYEVQIHFLRRQNYIDHTLFLLHLFVFLKVSYAKEYKLGGALIWEMSFDDFRGEYCNQGKFPLLRAINEYYG